MRHFHYPLLFAFPVLLSLSMLSASMLAQQKYALNDVPVLRVTKGEFGSDKCSDLVLTNEGEEVLMIQSFGWENNVGYEFAFPEPLPLVIKAGEQMNLKVCYFGSETDLPDDLLNITSNSRPAIAWGILVDASNSMEIALPCTNGPEGQRIEAARNAVRNIIDSILLNRPDIGMRDQFSMSSYSSQRQGFDIIPVVRNWIPLVSTSSSTRKQATTATESITVIGGTWTGHGLRSVFDTLEKSTLPSRVLVLLTDGPTNEDDQHKNPVQTIVDEAEKANIRIIALRIGEDAKELDTYLKEIATGTNGSFFSVQSCEHFNPALEHIKTFAHSNTVDQEPFPSGRTLSTPVEGTVNTKIHSLAIMNVWPNPASDAVEIQLKTGDGNHNTLSVYTTNGELILRQSIAVHPGMETSRMRLDTESLSPGTYLLVLDDGQGGSDQKKLVIAAKSRK